MKLLIFMVLVIIGCTADAAFALGVVGAAMNLSDATPKPAFSLYVLGDAAIVLGLLVAIPFRVQHLTRTAAQHALASRRGL